MAGHDKFRQNALPLKKVHSVKVLLSGGKTHHMISGFGDYQGGRFLIVGDNQHVFGSDDHCETWKHSRIPEEACPCQEVIAYGNGVFLVSYKDHVARPAEVVITRTLHETGPKGSDKSWYGLSFVLDESWQWQGRLSGESTDGAVDADAVCLLPLE